MKPLIGYGCSSRNRIEPASQGEHLDSV